MIVVSVLITGADFARALEVAGIITSKSTVPGETRKPWHTSGVRLGTAALASRGATEDHMARVAAMVWTGSPPEWAMIPATIALVVVQEMAARMGAVTGKGLSDLIREEFGFRWRRAFGVSVGALNATLIAQEEYERLYALWRSVKEADVYRKFWWLRVIWRLGVRRKLGIYDNRPLRVSIEKHAAGRPFRIPAHVGRVSLVSGAYELVDSDEPVVGDGQPRHRQQRCAHRDRHPRRQRCACPGATGGRGHRRRTPGRDRARGRGRRCVRSGARRMRRRRRRVGRRLRLRTRPARAARRAFSLCALIFIHKVTGKGK